MTNADQKFQTAVDMLTIGGSHRVWSLIVTLFGDLAQGEGDQISGALLSRLTGVMGVKPQAMRVALHRLRKDGWIDSSRDGRRSLHYLTDSGRAESLAATPRIYGDNTRAPDLWHVLICGGDAGGRAQLDRLLASDDYIAIGAQAVLGRGRPDDCCSQLFGFEASGLMVPDWIKTQICPDDLQQDYKLLHGVLEGVADAIKGTSFDPLETAVLRGLVVHSWRRVILRHPDLPASFFPDTWNGPATRTLFGELMTTLPRPSLLMLETDSSRTDSMIRINTM